MQRWLEGYIYIYTCEREREGERERENIMLIPSNVTKK